MGSTRFYFLAVLAVTLIQFSAQASMPAQYVLRSWLPRDTYTGLNPDGKYCKLVISPGVSASMTFAIEEPWNLNDKRAQIIFGAISAVANTGTAYSDSIAREKTLVWFEAKWAGVASGTRRLEAYSIETQPILGRNSSVKEKVSRKYTIQLYKIGDRPTPFRVDLHRQGRDSKTCLLDEPGR